MKKTTKQAQPQEHFQTRNSDQATHIQLWTQETNQSLQGEHWETMPCNKDQDIFLA